MTDTGTRSGLPDAVTSTTQDPARDRDTTRAETIAGLVMVGLVLLGALWLRSHTGPNFVDHWGSSFVHPALGNPWWTRLTYLKRVPVLVAGSILAALVVVLRDRWRALACLVAPTIAAVLTEYFFKPLTGRHFTQVLSYPAGTTTVVAALVMAWWLAVTPRFRPVVAVVGAFLVGLECMAVVALEWHYPSEAIAGAVFGVGFVLLVDGVVHLAVAAERRRHAGAPAPFVSPPPA